MDPLYIKGHYRLVSCYISLKDFIQAERSLKIAFRINPSHSDLLKLAKPIKDVVEKERFAIIRKLNEDIPTDPHSLLIKKCVYAKKYKYFKCWGDLKQKKVKNVLFFIFFFKF